MAASSFLAALRVHVLKVKFTSDELLSLDGTIIVHGGQIEPSPAKADVILTRLLSRRRLEMSLADGLVVGPTLSGCLLLRAAALRPLTLAAVPLQDNKVIVSDRWLHDCISLSRLLDYKLYLLPPDHADDFDVPAALASSASSASHSPMSSPEPQPIRKRNRTTTPAAYGGGAHGGPGAPPHDGFVWAVDAPASPPSSPAPPGVERLRLSSASPSLAPLPPLPSPDDYSPFPHVPDHLIPRSGTLIDPASLPTLACKRPSPLVCVNQRMCEELFVILLWKEVGEDDVGGGAALTDKHALSYKRAISARSRPAFLAAGRASSLTRPVSLFAGGQGLPNPDQDGRRGEEAPAGWRQDQPAGAPSCFECPSIVRLADPPSSLLAPCAQIGEYLQTGHIALASRLRRDGRLHCLLLFQTLHTVGPHAARDLYDVHGCRDLADVRAARPALALEVDYWGELHTKCVRGRSCSPAHPSIAVALTSASPPLLPSSLHVQDPKGRGRGDRGGRPRRDGAHPTGQPLHDLRR